MAALWFTPSPAPRYFLLPDGDDIPAGGLLIRCTTSEELAADEDWLLAHEIPAEEGRARMEQVGQDSLRQLGGALRQLWQLGRQAVIAETGEDPDAAFQAARAEARTVLQEAEAEAEAPLAELSESLARETTALFDLFQTLGAELAATLDSEDGRAALGLIGRQLSAYAEGAEPPAEE